MRRKPSFNVQGIEIRNVRKDAAAQLLECGDEDRQKQTCTLSSSIQPPAHLQGLMAKMFTDDAKNFGCKTKEVVD